jgi:hypothetical protein
MAIKSIIQRRKMNEKKEKMRDKNTNKETELREVM